jgi:hypothetical protein
MGRFARIVLVATTQCSLDLVVFAANLRRELNSSGNISSVAKSLRP